jgi:serine/threonine-protein kinase
VTDTTGSRRFGSSLGTRISLVTVLLIALSVGVAVGLTSLLIRRIARNAALESLQSSSAVQTTYQEQHFDRLKLNSRIFVSDAAISSYLAQHDTASTLDLLTERQKDLGFDFAIVTDSRGRVVARTDNPGAVGQDLSHRPLLAKAIAENEAAGVWQEGKSLYYAVAVPVSKDFDLYGFLVTGFAINDASALELSRISGTDVAFVTAGQQPEILATTLPLPTARALAATLRSDREEVGQALRKGQALPRTELSLDGEPWFALLSPLRDAAGQPVGATVALASVGKELAVYRQIETLLAVIGLISALLGGALSFFLAQRALRPVHDLAVAADAASQGDYDRRISSDRTDEVGQLAQAFDELLADLREKRDMQAYVTELSRNLPEPVPQRSALGEPQSREILLMGVELRRYARHVEARPAETLDLLAIDLERISTAVSGQRGQIEGLVGHRVMARFEGAGRGRRALSAAALILGETATEDPAAEADAPAVALAAGRAVTGPVAHGDQVEHALVGLPVQQIEGLLREATPGELLLSREVHEELKDSFEQAGYRLAERRGLLSPQPLYVVSGRMAVRLTSVRGIGETAAATLGGLSKVETLSGISPGALMGQRFEILSVLGSGGMGVVYKARDRELDDLVALKMLKRELWGDRTQLDRLKSELKLARKITHPNVLRTYDFGDIDGVPYISMEYVRGVTLRYLLDQTHRLPFSAGLRLAKQLCAGLGAAHAVGVVHRDIKPENLILEPTGNAKLMDFGIAKPVKRLEAGQTEAGWIVGTPLYLSPEQLEGREVDTRADLYSCGVVLYEIFTGALPFQAPGAFEIMLKHLQEPPPPPHLHWAEIPPRLEAAILRCLEKDPDARYPTVDELLRDLESLST